MGQTYEISLLDSKIELLEGTAFEAKNLRNVLYQGVNGVNDNVEVITLWHDLKCTKRVVSMGVSLEKSIPNLKKIIELNRKVHSVIEMEYAIL